MLINTNIVYLNPCNNYPDHLGASKVSIFTIKHNQSYWQLSIFEPIQNICYTSKGTVKNKKYSNDDNDKIQF